MEKIDKFLIEYEDAVVPLGLAVIGAVYMKNGCCKDKPVLVTETSGFNVYSCQCACGGWCSDGFDSISKAIADYERMSREKSNSDE